ncbi:MAG: DNA adenine methylase [Gammaproteobacteria bacterium]|nr:MAG: DNA adenine methylase [Gammaproteobacteria bacterium]
MAKGINKSFLKWAGGKSSSLRMIIQHGIERVDGRFIEPFVGSGVVFLNMEAFGYIVGDFNCDLIRLYDFIKADGGGFIDYCGSFFTPETSTEDTYYEFRKKFNNVATGSRERAALFVYLNRHSFNGLCRYNARGLFNVPWGKHKENKFPRKEMLFFEKKARLCEFHCQDFGDTIALAQKDDIIYCDPPYVPIVEGATSFTDYTMDGFTLKDQKRLVKLAEESTNKFLISNHDTEITRDLYKNADKILTRKVGRYIGGTGATREPVVELLAVYNI